MGPLFGERGAFEVPFEVPRFHLRSRIPDTFDQNTWWGTQIHGGVPTYMVAWPASRPDGASKYVMAWPASRPGFGKHWRGPWPTCVWVSHHVFSSKVSGILERKWNIDSENGTQLQEMEHEWNADLTNGTRMERGFTKCNANGMRIQNMERKWNTNAKKDNNYMT